MRLVRNLSFGLLVVVVMLAGQSRVKANDRGCSFVGYNGPDPVCETSVTALFCTNFNTPPAEFQCGRDFDETCSAFCGSNLVVAGNCEWTSEYIAPGDDMPAIWCVENFYIWCQCSDQ